MTPFQRSVLLMALRNLMKLGGFSGAVISDDVLLQVVSAVVMLGGFALSLYNDWQKTHQPRG